MLVLRREQNAIAALTEAAPNVFHEIGIDQDAHRVLQFQMILNNEGMAVRSADKWSVPGLPEMIAQNFDIGRGRGGAASAEHDALAGGFQKVVLNQEGTVLSIAYAPADGLRIGASAGNRYAVEIAEIRIDDSRVGHAIQAHPVVSFILEPAMQPGAIDHDVIGGALSGHQRCGPLSSGGSRDLKADEAIEIRSGCKLEWTIAHNFHLHRRHHVLRICAAILRTPDERSDSGITRCGSSSLWRQSAVWRTGADPDPIVDVTVLGWHDELATEGCARLQLDYVAALSIVQRRLQIAAGIDADNRPRRGSVAHGTGDGRNRQFCRAIVSAGLRFRLRHRQRCRHQHDYEQEYRNG